MKTIKKIQYYMVPILLLIVSFATVFSQTIWVDEAYSLELAKHSYMNLTESSKSPASIAKSNKQWVGTCLYQEWYKPLLISCEAAIRL